MQSILINPKKNFIKGLYCLKQRMTSVSPRLKCLKYERLIGLSDFEDILVTRLYFRGVWTVVLEIMLLKLMQEKRADTRHAIGGPTESAQKNIASLNIISLRRNI